jgi:signal transduction histidine kinase
MTSPDIEAARPVSTEMESKLARCRLIISLIAIAALCIDPTEPTHAPWLGLNRVGHSVDPVVLGVMGAHLLYSLALSWRLLDALVPQGHRPTITTWIDVLFGAAIVTLTEGTSSPFWPLIVFAVMAAGAEGDFRRSLVVTTVSVGIYLSLILIAWHGQANLYMMRPVQLAVVGYLTAYLGKERLSLGAEVHRLAAAKERTRIARALHDGCVQTLGGINLTLESCKELVGTGRAREAIAGLTTLQASINREHDELRAYVRELADVEATTSPRHRIGGTRFVVNADFAGSALLVEQVLQIVREAVTNVTRHARASLATIAVRSADAQVSIAIDDNGVGFTGPEQVPWSMAARVSDAGGIIRVDRDGTPGAHLRLALPEA